MLGEAGQGKELWVKNHVCSACVAAKKKQCCCFRGKGGGKGGWGGSEKGAEKGEERTASTEELSRCVELSQTRNVHLNP